MFCSLCFSFSTLSGSVHSSQMRLLCSEYLNCFCSTIFSLRLQSLSPSPSLCLRRCPWPCDLHSISVYFTFSSSFAMAAHWVRLPDSRSLWHTSKCLCSQKEISIKFRQKSNFSSFMVKLTAKIIKRYCDFALISLIYQEYFIFNNLILWNN